MKKSFALLILALWGIYCVAQSRHYSAVNPIFFTHSSDDIYLGSLSKYNNGSQLLSPNPSLYPWEERLENGMPNVLVDSLGNISVYFSSFIVYSPSPPSKVGVMVFTNTTNSFSSWSRPSAGLYWYNPSGTTADEKISPVFQSGYLPTNLVAVDIESLGIFDDGSNSPFPIKLIYMPQREFFYKYLGAYEMPRNFNSDGILNGFAEMKLNRQQNQSVFAFKNINADTHMNWMLKDSTYYFTSRVNSRRSALKQGETPPFSTDPRKRYRRSTITQVGDSISSKHLDFHVVLDYSTKEWEPYGMQPFRLPGFEDDIWFGLATMYGVEGYTETEMKQRTELVYSLNGQEWYYLKPGIPILANGTDPNADDYGCINIATPVYNTKLHSGFNQLDPFFFYASSRIGHTEGRNPGLSLATAKYGKVVGLTNDQIKSYYSSTPKNTPNMTTASLPTLSILKSFAINSHYVPYVMGDITDDPSGVDTSALNSYVQLSLFEYNPDDSLGLGDFLGGCMGSSQTGTHNVSNEYCLVPFAKNRIPSNSKQHLLSYLKKYSDNHPDSIVSFKGFRPIPLVVKTEIKNSIFYGVKFQEARDHTVSIDCSNAKSFNPSHQWSYSPAGGHLSMPYVESFTNRIRTINTFEPTMLEEGAITANVTPTSGSDTQTILRIENDGANYITLDYLQNGQFRYEIVKEGESYVNLQIAPPTGYSFAGKEVNITIEAVKLPQRIHGTTGEETSIMSISCNALTFEDTVSQEIIWNFRNVIPTPVDSAYARGYAYLPFVSFVGDMKKIIVGGSSESGASLFNGIINQVAISKNLNEDEE